MRDTLASIVDFPYLTSDRSTDAVAVSSCSAAACIAASKISWWARAHADGSPAHLLLYDISIVDR